MALACAMRENRIEKSCEEKDIETPFSTDNIWEHAGDYVLLFCFGVWNEY